MAIDFHRDGPWDLPEGWVWARLGDVAAINPKTSFEELADDLELPFVPMAAMAEETGIVDYARRRPVRQLKKGFTRFQSGDVLFAKITPCMENGKSAPVLHMPAKYGAGSTEFHVLRSRAIEPRYLWYWLVRRSFRGDARKDMTGSAGQMRVSGDYLKGSVIAIPPLAEQTRIVGRIDALLLEVADGGTELTRARTNLDAWRRTLLKAALTGELSCIWRDQNRPNHIGNEFAQKLRNAVAEEALLSGFSVRPIDGLEERNADLTDLPELPDGWVWSTIGEIGLVSGGLTKNQARKKLKKKLAYLRVANVQYGYLDLADVQTIGISDAEIGRVLLKPNDLLIVEGNGSADQIGRCALWTGEITPCVHQNHLIKVRFSEGSVAEWAHHWIMSPHGRQLITAVASSTSGLHTLSLSKIRAIPIPVPPETELLHVLGVLGAGIDERTTIQTELGLGARAVNALRQSIFKSAFEGKLVAQDPRDEPADVMLARLNQPAETNMSHRAKARR